MGSPVLGIDLGTTNSAVAVAIDGKVQVLPDAEGNKLFPSVVSFHPSGDVLAGYPARERRLVDAPNTVYSVKRLIGRPFKSEEVRRATERLPFAFEEGPTGGALVVARGETYTLPEISAFVLRGVRAQAEDALKQSCRRAVITVPANFNELQRSATKAAGRVAGLEVLRILNEPTAAALAYGCGANKEKERIAVYDLGGGTFDVTILELAGEVFEVVATAGDTFLGGDDIDVALADHMVQAFLSQQRYDARRDAQAYERLRAAAEWAKCQLSTTEDVELTVEELAYGDGGASLDLKYSTSRERVETVARPLISRTFAVCEEALKLAGLRPSQLDQVILVGGSTRMPLVRRMVEEFFGRPPLSNIDPDLVVAQGAAIQGAALAGQAELAAHTPAAGAAIGRVALKKVAAAVGGGDKRAPQGPAFQPKRPVGQALPAPAIPPGAAAGRTLQGVAAPKIPGAAAAKVPAASAAQPRGPTAQGARTLSGMPVVKPAALGKPLAPPPVEFGDDEPSGLLLEDPSGLVLDEPSGFLMEDDSAPSLKPAASGSRVAPLPAADIPDLGPPPEPEAEEIALPQGKSPLLLDVTPQTLRIETVAGFTEVIIQRNAAIPVEQSRMFSTSQDFQDAVRARVCQGESRKLAENQELGAVELIGLVPQARGKTQIEVTFVMDADGTLQVRAKDMRTGSAQSIRINLVGAVQDDEIARMQRRQQLLVG
jgi:molecular chaperone DnaK